MIDLTLLMMFLNSIFREAFAWIGGVLLVFGFFLVVIQFYARIRNLSF